MRVRQVITSLFTGALVTLVVVYTLFPYIVALLTALTPTSATFNPNLPWRVPNPPTLENFVFMWSVVPLARYLRNSLIVCSMAVVLIMTAASMAAYGLANLRFRFSRPYLQLILITQMVSPAVLVVPLYRVAANLGLTNSLLGLAVMDAAFALPFTIWLLYGFYLAVPRELLEAAAVDGCGPFARWARVVLPVVRPGSVVALVFAFAFVWNEFLFAFTFLRKQEEKVLGVGIFDFIGQWTISWNYMMAATLLAALPFVLLFMALERRIIAGLTEGAIK